MDLITARKFHKHPGEHLGKKINMEDWVRSLRDSRAFGFVVVSDRSSFEALQTVCRNTLPNFAEVSRLSVRTAILVRGTLVSTPRTKQSFGTQTAEVTMEGTSSPDYPLQEKHHSLELLRTVSRLHPRTNTFQAVFRVYSLTAYAAHQYFQERDFVYVHTPLIAGNDCKGAGEVFQITTMDLSDIPKTEDGEVNFSQDFFGKAANLTVSGQLGAETYTMTFRNVYAFGPIFHAENPNTTRHAARFRMVEPETIFADLDDNMCLAEGMLKYIIRFVLGHTPEEMNFFNQSVDKGLPDRLHNVLNSEFGRITYTEAVKIPEERNDEFDYKVSWGYDLRTEHGRYLTEQVSKKLIFVTDYPKEIRTSYMKTNPDNKTVAVTDCLILGIDEIIDGNQREDDYGRLAARMNEPGLKKENYDFYLDLRKYSSTRHAGFGLGFERCVMYLTGMSSIRDIIPFPRTVSNCGL